MSDSESELPSTWLSLKLGDVVAYGKTEKAEPEDIAPETWVLELEDLEKDTTKVLQRLTFAERQSKSTKNKFDAGDVLYGKLRPYLNKVTFADSPGVCTTEIVPIKPNETVHGRYLFHWLRHPAFLTYVTEVSHGVNMPRLGTDAGREAPFVLAPKAEQKRIADKLDTVLTRVDAVNTRLARVAPLLKRFRQSVLAAATSGRLTEDWRNQNHTSLVHAINDLRGIEVDRLRMAKRPKAAVERVKTEEFNIPSTWVWTSLDALTAKIVDGTHHTPSYVEQGIPFISVKDIRDGLINFSNTKFITEQEHAELSKRCCVERGDLLITKSGTIGRTAIVATDTSFSLFVSVALIKPASKYVNMNFIDLALQHWVGSIDVASRIVGSTIKNLHLVDMKVLGIPFPSLEEQTEIVRRVETLFAFADRLEARLAQAQTAATRLTPALLAKAFRGELVPQDPNDEPAAASPRKGRKAASTATT